MCSGQNSKEGGGVRVAPTWCTSWTNQGVAQWGGLKAPAWCIWTLEACSTLKAWTRGWSPVNIVAHTETLSSQNLRKGKKNWAQIPLPRASRKTSRTPLAGLVSRLFFPKCETIRPRAVKTTKTDPERDQKGNAKNWDKFHFAIL